MNSVVIVISALLVMAGAPVVPAAAQARAADDPRQILADYETHRRTRSAEHVGEIVVTARNGTVRRKEWRSYHEGFGASSNRLIRFLAPPDIRGVGYLRRHRAGQPADEWLYLPSMQRERRIVQSDRHAAFVGTDFTYEDLEDLEVLNQDDYDVARLPDRIVDGVNSHVIELRPRRRSEYDRKVTMIGKDTLSLLQVEYVRRGERGASKRLSLTDYRDVDGRRVAMTIDMADLRKGSHTTLRLRSVVLDRPQPADRFTIQNLVREDDVGMLRWPARPEGVRADAGAVPQAAARPRPAVAGTFTGSMEARGTLFLGTSSPRDAWAEGWGIVALRTTARLWRVRLAAAVRAEANSSPKAGPLAFDPADRLPLRSPLSVRELSLVVPVTSGVDLQVGRFPVAWSSSERLSPSDAFLPRDTSDPLTHERLPLWGYHLRGERSGIRFEAVATHTTTPWRLPPLDGRHSPLASLDIFLKDLPSAVPRRGFVAARVAGLVGTWDIGAWARRGVRPAPIIELYEDLEEETAQGTILPIRRRYADESALGVQLSRPYRGWLVEGELAVMRSNDADLGNAVIWSVNCSHPVRTGTFLGTFAMNSVATPVDPLLLFDRALLPAFIVGVRQTESWGNWRAGWLATFSRVGGLLTADAVKDLTEVIKLTGGIDLPHGDAFSPARAFAGHKRVRAGVRWEW